MNNQCANCGTPVETPAPVSCKLCDYVGIGVGYCHNDCQSEHLQKHSKVCAGPRGRKIDVNNPSDWKHFCTKNCRIEIITPRIRIRPVELEDTPRVFKIKNDRLVSDNQLYGRVDDERMCRAFFVEGYVRSLIACLPSASSTTTNSRNRYVFAIEPRLISSSAASSSDGTTIVPAPQRSISPLKHPKSKHSLDSNGYIGNIAIELIHANREEERGFSFMSEGPRLGPKKGEVYCRPTREDLEGKVKASLFYEIHPDFWQQGILTEVLREIISFTFNILSISTIIIDPQPFNLGSIRLAEKLGFELVGEKKNNLFGKIQLVYELRYEDWVKRKKSGGNKKKKKKGKGKGKKEGEGDEEDGEKGTRVENEDGNNNEVEAKEETRQKMCRWCQIPSHFASIPCQACSWSFWCSQSCKTADLTYELGHMLECDGLLRKKEKEEVLDMTIPEDLD